MQYGSHGFGGFPSGGSPTIINNISPGGGGYGGGGYGGGYGGGGGGGGSGFNFGGLGTTLLTAGAFYGLGRLTAPSYSSGSSFGGPSYAGSGHAYGQSNEQHVYHHHMYDQQNVTTKSASDPLPGLVPIAAYPGAPPQEPQAQQPGAYVPQSYHSYSQELTQRNGGISPGVAALAGLGTGAAVVAATSTNSKEVAATNPQNVTVQIPRVNLNNTPLYVPTVVSLNETYIGPLDYWPYWLNLSIEYLPFYGYNYPTWNEVVIIPLPDKAKLVDAVAPRMDIQMTTTLAPSPTTTPEPKVEGFAAKLGKWFMGLADIFSFGKKSPPAAPVKLDGRDGIDSVEIAAYPNDTVPRVTVIDDMGNSGEKVKLATV